MNKKRLVMLVTIISVAITCLFLLNKFHRMRNFDVHLGWNPDLEDR